MTGPSPEAGTDAGSDPGGARGGEQRRVIDLAKLEREQAASAVPASPVPGAGPPVGAPSGPPPVSAQLPAVAPPSPAPGPAGAGRVQVAPPVARPQAPPAPHPQNRPPAASAVPVQPARGPGGPGYVEVPVASPSPEVFAEIIRRLPPGYALVPAGYELRLAPPRRATAAAPAAAGARRPGTAAAKAAPTGTFPPTLKLWSAGLTAFGILLLVVTANLLAFGHVKHARDQRVALDALRIDLANGTAAVNQKDDDGKLLELGRPLGIIDIPLLDLHEVYLEGTTSRVLSSGVGHRRDTVMPGQRGTSFLMGRHAAYGGPFAALADLPTGADVYITNGMGSRIPFRVVAVRRQGDALPKAPVNGARVTFVTADGGPFVPDGGVRVDADLVQGATTADKQPFAAVTPGPLPLTYTFLPRTERALAGNGTAWLSVVIGLALMLPLASAATYARQRWGRWQAWLSAVPPLLAVAIWTSDAVIQLLPNVM